MIRSLVDFALNNRILVLSLAVLLFIWGLVSFHNLPIEAYPDVADTYVQIISQWPGHVAEEVEQQITVPLEVQLNGVPHLTHLRSLSLAGLSVITMIYDDDISTFTARQEVLDRLAQATMPTGVNPGLGPDYSPTGGFCVSLERKRRVATRLLEVGSFVMPRRRAAVCVRAASGACIDRSNRRLTQFFPFYRIDKFRRMAETCGVHWA